VAAAKTIPGHHQVIELLGDCAMIHTTKTGAVAGVLLLVALDEPLYIGILAPQWLPGLAKGDRRDRRGRGGGAGAPALAARGGGGRVDERPRGGPIWGSAKIRAKFQLITSNILI
jgi:hypothetical protein